MAAAAESGSPLENAGFRTFGFGAGREDVWEPDLDVDWGDEKEWLKHRHPESLEKQALGATEMGLIFLNATFPASIYRSAQEIF
jgi:catalase-peroxidase